MADELPPLVDRLRARFESKLLRMAVERDETTIEVAPDALLEVCRTLRDDPEFRFEQLVDVSGIDYLGFGDDEWDTSDVTYEGYSRGVEGLGPGRFNWEQRPAVSGGAGRFAAVLHLLSIIHNRRLRVRCFGADDSLPVVPSVVEIWPGANWFEREAFDLFGIVFEGHPDLRRILTDYGFVGHPFRKDFPLIGNVEVRYDPEKGRVVYEPVSIDPRVGVPRVIRRDSRYEQAQAELGAGQGK
jgi:NADH-quinone oxidoreductase subunit C